MEKQSKFFYSLSKFVFSVIFHTVYPCKFLTKNTIPDDGNAYILCANHLTALDPFIIGYGQNRTVCYMAKEELFKRNWERKLMLLYGCIPVSHDASASFALRKGYKSLREGKVLGIFPEGTRSKDGTIGEFKLGTLLLAERAAVKIIPAALYSKCGKIKAFHRTYVKYGEPVDIKNLGADSGSSEDLEKATQALKDIIEDLIEDCRLTAGGKKFEN